VLVAEDCPEVGVEYLDRHVSLVAKVAREIHGGHTSGADLSLDDVAARKRGGEVTQGLRHGSKTCCEPRGIARSVALTRSRIRDLVRRRSDSDDRPVTPALSLTA